MCSGLPQRWGRLVNLIGFGCALRNQLGPNAVRGLDILLFNPLDGDETHVRSAHGFADSNKLSSMSQFIIYFYELFKLKLIFI